MAASLPITLSYKKSRAIAESENESSSDESTNACLSTMKFENKSATEKSNNDSANDTDAHISYFVEEDEIYEETIQLNERYNKNNKSINKLTIRSHSLDIPELDLHESELCDETTDIEDLITSDEELSTEIKYGESDVLNKIYDGTEYIAISDKIKKNDCHSPLVTPEPPKQMIKKKYKLNKSSHSKQFLLQPLQSDMQCTDTEYLISNSESEGDIEQCNKMLPLLKKRDGWITDIEDLSHTSEDEIGNIRSDMKSSSFDCSFYKELESGSDEDFFEQKIQNRKFKMSTRKKAQQPKIIIRQVSEGHCCHGKGKLNDSAVYGKKHTGYYKQAKDSSKILCKNSLNQFENYQVYEETNIHGHGGGCFRKNNKHKLSSTKSDKIKNICTDLKNESVSRHFCPKPLTIRQKDLFMQSQITDTESIYSDEDAKRVNYEGSSSDKNKYSSRKQIIKKTNKPEILYYLNKKQTDTSQSNSNVKQKEIMKKYNNASEPLTDVEELLFPTDKNYVSDNIKEKIFDSGITDTEEIELTDSDVLKAKLSVISHLENIPITDIDEFSAPEDGEDITFPKTQPLPPIDYSIFIHSDSITTDKEGISSQYSSESKNQYETDITAVPLIKTISPSPTFQNTDSEDMIESAEEGGYSRNITPILTESKLEFEDNSSVVLVKSTRTFNVEGEEYLHVKEATETHEPLTDIEDLYTQDENQSSVQSIAFQINNLKADNHSPRGVTKTKVEQEDGQEKQTESIEQGEQSQDMKGDEVQQETGDAGKQDPDKKQPDDSTSKQA